ncbi:MULTISPECIES: mechanosensitive ion channel family protein [unclassified Cupriavidus]|uniref:mechanosensitive ion channel family protein n=1 Tax=unclassified Cupriavidus TaxID=2640874 RepID=UPI0010F8A782|nr:MULTISPECIES: mechanosensitive ion channel family protein [unclassified Cupriavidus]MWL90333.1 mechanosensitive ion channel [Cupriavidus sp. SW-Y-13]
MHRLRPRSLFCLLSLWTAALLLVLAGGNPAMAAGSPILAAVQKAEAPPASAPAASAPLAQSLDEVIHTLQNDKDRQALVTQLQTLRRGLDASAAGASSAAASASDASPGLIGAVAQALQDIDRAPHKDRGPWQYWRWRIDFAGEEWHEALTVGRTRSSLESWREFGVVLLGWAATGWVFFELSRRLHRSRVRGPRPTPLPTVPSWIDVGIYFLRRIGPWIIAFGLTLLLAYQVFGRTPASMGAVLVAYAIVAGAIMSAVCQVIFALFQSGHRRAAVRDLLGHSPLLLFVTGALAALGEANTDPRVIASLGVNLSALISTLANILAAILIGVFAVRFRRAIGQLIACRPFAFRQEHPALMDLLRMTGEAWYLPMLAVVVASVIGTIMATGHADEFLRRAVLTVALFVSATLLTLVVGRSPKATKRAPRLRDRRRSAYIQRFGRFGVAIVRVAIWVAFLELNARIWNTSLMRLAEATVLGRHITQSILSVIGVVLLAWLVWLLIDTAITQSLTPGNTRAPQPSLRARTILPLVRNASFVALLVVAMIAVLANLGVNVTPLLAGAGVVGLAIGFGAQSLVQDLITGLFIVIEDSIAIGDSIELPDHSGVVEGMTIRTVRLRDGKGALHTLPYSQIKAVKNLSRGYAFAVFNISISYQSDFDRALEIIRETGAEVSSDYRYSRNLLSGLDILGLDRFDPNGQVVLAQFKTRPLMQSDISRAFNIRLKRNFDAEGIRMAAPYVTVQVDGGSAENAIAAAAGAGAEIVTSKAPSTT